MIHEGEGQQGAFWDDPGPKLAPSRAPGTLARRGDPETSVEGARAAERSRTKVYEAILANLDGRARPATAREIGKATRTEAWKRMRELANGNLVKACATRKCRITGRPAMTWTLIPKKKAAE